MRKCPRCGCTTFYGGPGGGGAQNAICANCRAYVNNTPFGIKVLYKDAVERDPSILDWWFEEQKKAIKIDGDKSLRPKPPKWNPTKR